MWRRWRLEIEQLSPLNLQKPQTSTGHPPPHTHTHHICFSNGIILPCCLHHPWSHWAGSPPSLQNSSLSTFHSIWITTAWSGHNSLPSQVTLCSASLRVPSSLPWTWTPFCSCFSWTCCNYMTSWRWEAAAQHGSKEFRLWNLMQLDLKRLATCMSKLLNFSKPRLLFLKNGKHDSTEITGLL